MSYKTEGFIKTISINGTEVTFTFDPTPPYCFDEKNNKKILLKGDADSFMSRKLDEHFKTELLDLASLITLKSNKVKVRLTCACDKDLKIVRLAKSRMCVEGVSVSIDPKDFKITAVDVL